MYVDLRALIAVGLVVVATFVWQAAQAHEGEGFKRVVQTFGFILVAIIVSFLGVFGVGALCALTEVSLQAILGGEWAWLTLILWFVSAVVASLIWSQVSQQPNPGQVSVVTFLGLAGVWGVLLVLVHGLSAMVALL